MLLLILIVLVTENVYLVQNEKVERQDSIDSTNFKNALAKELLKKKLLNLESARQQDSLAQFLRKGEKNPARGKPNFSVDDDPSRKQAQMANSFIASSNLLFGTKSQRRPCNAANKPASKEAVLDMQYLRRSFSGFNEEGVDFPSSRDASTLAIRKRSSKKGQDPISCYLTEPRKITCMHKDIIYKIQLPSSDVADDEIGRIVESIYRAVEGNRASIGKSSTVEDTYKTKRASDDYLKSLFLNNLLAGNHPKTAIMPAYNGNNAIYLPLIIPVSQPKIDAGKVPLSYYPGFLVDPKLQRSYNMSISGGVDALNGIGGLGRNILVDNGYGNQYLLPASYFMAANVRQRSENNSTADEERRRNWLALMATNGYVPVDNGINAKLTNSIQPHVVEGVQSLSEDKVALGSNNKLTIAETGEYLDKLLLNQRQERDTYYLRRQLRNKPYSSINTNRTFYHGGQEYSDRLREEKYRQLSKIIQTKGEPILEGRANKGPPCPCPSPCPPPKLCPSTTTVKTTTKCTTTKCTTTCSPKCSTSCRPKCPPPPQCPLPCPTRCPPPCPPTCPPECPKPCPPECPKPCPPECPSPCPPECPCPCACPIPCPNPCPRQCPECELRALGLHSLAIPNDAQYGLPQLPCINVLGQQISRYPLYAPSNKKDRHMHGISSKTLSHSGKEPLSTNSSEVDSKSKKRKDSFFTRLRSKFHKGTINGMGSMENSFGNRMQNKSALHPIVRFNQGPPGQVLHVSYQLSVLGNEMKHPKNNVSTTPQQTIQQPTIQPTQQPNQTRSYFHFNQPNQPNQPMIPLNPQQPQPSANQPPSTANQTNVMGNQLQPTGNLSQPLVCQPLPPQPPVNQSQTAGNQSLPSGNKTPPSGNQLQPQPPLGQPQPPIGQPQPTFGRPQPPLCQSQPPQGQAQPPLGQLQPQMSQPQLPSECAPSQLGNQPQTTKSQSTPTPQCSSTSPTITTQTQFQTNLTTKCNNDTISTTTCNYISTQRLSPTTQRAPSSIPALFRKIGIPQYQPNYIIQQGSQQLEYHLNNPSQSQYMQRPQHPCKAPVQQRPQEVGRLPDQVWQPASNDGNRWKQPPKQVNWAPMGGNPGQTFLQTYLNQSQIYPNQVLHTTHLRIQPNIPSQSHNIGQSVAHRIANTNRVVNRLPRTSFKWGTRHKAMVQNGSVPTSGGAGTRGTRKVKWPSNPYSLYEQIARVRRYLQNREKRRRLKR